MSLGYGCSGVPFKGRIFFLPFLQRETGDRTAQRCRSLAIPRVLVRVRTGKAQQSGRSRLVRGAAHWWPVCGGLSHP